LVIFPFVETSNVDIAVLPVQLPQMLTWRLRLGQDFFLTAQSLDWLQYTAISMVLSLIDKDKTLF